MKNKFIILIIIVFAFSACGSIKKMDCSESTIKMKSTTVDSIRLSKYVDTTKIDKGIISIIEVQFYKDSFPESIATIDGKISGNMKSAKITTIKKENVNKGISKIDSVCNKSNVKIVDKKRIETKQQIRYSYPWICVFGLIIVIFIIGLFKYRTIWDWIKKILLL